MTPEDSAPKAAQTPPPVSRVEPRRQTSRRWLLPFFAAALVFFTGILFHYWEWITRYESHSVAMLFCHAGVYCEFGLLAIWLGLGGGNAWQRVAAVAAAAVLNVEGWYACNILRGPRDDEFLQTVLPQLGFGAALTLAAVALPLGWKRRNRGIGATPSPPPARSSPRQRGQFTLAQCFLAITAIGVLLGLARLPDRFVWQAIYALSIALKIHVSLWTAQAVGARRIRLAILFGCTLFVSLCLMSLNEFGPGAMRWLIWGGDDRIWNYWGHLKSSDALLFCKIVAQTLLETALLAAILGIVRQLGYRLEFIAPPKPTSKPAPAGPDGQTSA